MRIATEPATEDVVMEDVVTEDVIIETTDVLVKALRGLGQAGRPDAASRLAATAWWALRTQHPRQAERINGVMHYLARLPVEPGAQPTEAPALSTPLEEA
jgi:hypothetical protein